MKALLSGAVFCAAVCLSTTFVRAQTLFSYEPGEPGMPYTGNPGIYTASTSTTTGVTNGTQAVQVSVPIPAFGGPGSAALTDALRAAEIDAAPAVAIDMTVPNKTFGFGNIDLQFFQAGMRGGAGNDEARFSPTFALSPGQTITLQIPLDNTQFGSPHILLDPALPWSYQIDLSFNSADTGPFVFQFDNLRVVPEPTSLLSIAMGALLLTRRRLSK
jgi:hypothetical protein